MPPETRTEIISPHLPRMAVGQIERLLILRTFPGFAELAPEMVGVLADHTRERFFPAGSYLLRAGEPIDAIHFIVQGRVEMRRHGERYREMGPKSAVGGLAAFARDPHGYDVIALEDCVSLEERIDDAVDIFEDHFPILRGVMRALAREVMRLRRNDDPKAGFVETDDPGPACPPDPLDFVERMALIRESMTFAKTRVEAVADLARDAREVRMNAGETIWHEGDPPGDTYILVSGIVECRTDEGQRFRFGPGDVIGALDGMAMEPRWFTPTIIRDMVALKISSESMYDIFEDNFDIAMDLIEGMAIALMAMYDKQSGLAPREGSQG
jgi:CRP-like cAMP-binding protein